MKKIIRRVVLDVLGSFRAFMLVEVLVVIGILGCIGLLATYISRIYIIRSRDFQRKYNLEQMRNAIEDFYDTSGFFPPALPGCGLPLEQGNLIYLKQTPCDPKHDIPYTYVTDQTEKSGWYKLYTNLEYTEDSDIDYTGCRTGCGPNCQYNYGVASTNTEVMGCSEIVPTIIPILTPTPILYACAPGGGQEGVCEQFDDPERSECPKAYPNDPTCQNECAVKINKCKNESGKHVPE